LSPADLSFGIDDGIAGDTDGIRANHRVDAGEAPTQTGHMARWQEFLGSSPQVYGGEICATGTRIPVTVILDSLAEGATKDEVLASYPSLRVDHINAALAYAAELAHEERLVPIRAL
jgi:uncharacterized protein (DUF433 family)